jgi:aspartate/methionine/tyrosine aminotransferase
MQLSPFKLERYFAKYEFTTEFLLSSSDCESLTIRGLLSLEEGAHDRFLEVWLGYTESQGAPKLRQEISQVYTSIQPEEILVHSGAEEAIYLFMHATVKTGDHMIVHSPCYQSLFEVARSTGCEVTLWKAREENGWALDIDDLRRSIRGNTRAVVVNTPHNPTGYLMAKDDYIELNRLALENNLVLFSDEVYREAEYDPEDRLPAACDINELAISLGVTSKTYGLPGLRIGWIASHNAEINNRMAMLKDYTTICNSAPSEYLAELAIRHREKLARRSLDLIGSNLKTLDQFFSRHADKFDWIKPKAGPIAFPKLEGESVESFCHELVTRANVLLVPGSVFEDSGNHFRIGFGRKNLPKAVARLEKFLDSRSG